MLSASTTFVWIFGANSKTRNIRGGRGVARTRRRLGSDAAHPAADTITAALFLREFTAGLPWAHIDTAGTAYLLEPHDAWPEGATGSPARTLIRYIEAQAAGRSYGS